MMTFSRLHILVVEDNPGDYVLIEQMLEGITDFSKQIYHVTTLAKAITAVTEQIIDVILLDLSLSDSHGIESFTRLSLASPQTPILILSGLNDTRFAHDAVKNGAQDYLVKGEFEQKLLAKSILYSIERYSNMELLRQSQDTYRELFENNPIPMYIREKDTMKIVKVNQSAVEHFGYSEEEFLSMDVTDLHPDNDEEEFLHNASQYDGDHTSSQIFRHVKKNGSIITVECRVRELMFDGRPCFMVLADDITDKRRVQEEVIVQANILKNVRDTIFVTDRKGIITYWNEGAEETFGYPRSEMLGRSYDKLYPDIDKHIVKKELEEIIDKKLFQWESRLISGSDQIIWSDNKASMLYNESGKVTGYIRVCKDITQSKRFGEKQKETVAMLNSIFNNVTQSIVLIDQHRRVKAFNVKANRQCIQLMGLELVENARFDTYLLEDMREQFSQKFKTTMTGSQVHFEMGYRFSGTSIHWFGVNLSPVSDENGVVLGVCLSMMDVTERKTGDEKFRGQYVEIEKTNKELDKLVKILSHDLRAPMNSVKGLINLARDEKNPDEFRNYLNMMEKSVNKLETFTVDIITSLRSRGMDPASDVNMSTLISDIIEELRFADGASDIKIENDIPKDLVIKSDPVRLRVVLANLISNAIRYHDPAKSLRFIRVTANRFSDKVEVLISDNGIGIAREHQEKIFESYFTIGNHSDSNGLGLSNVKDAVVKLNGKITVDSKPGEGSTFKVVLPTGG